MVGPANRRGHATMQRPRPPGPRPQYNPGLQQVPMCFTDAANIMPPRGPAMWGPPQPAPPMHGGEYPAFMHHGNFGQGPWGPYGPGGHPGDMQPRPVWNGPKGGPPGRSPGWGPPGRGRSPGRGFPPGRSPQGGRLPGKGRAMPGSNGAQQNAHGQQGRGQAPPQKHAQQSQGQGKSKKQKLAELDEKPPKPWKPLNTAELAEGQRWQEERRKRYPTDANVAKRGSEAAARQQRGELDPEGEAARARLHEIVARQQELGLLKEAGTADLLRAASGRGAGLRGGRVVRPGRQAGRGPGRGRGFAGDNGHGRGQKRSADFPERDEGASKQPRLDALALSPPGGVDGNALDGLVSYNSDSDGDGAQEDGPGMQKPTAQPPRPSLQAPRQANGSSRGGRHGSGQGRGRGRQVTQPVAQRDPTLLEKLLAKDIRTEHSRLLQCMRFIVANNFLQDVGAKALQFPPEPPAAAGQAPRLALPDLQQDLSDSDDAAEAVANAPVAEQPSVQQNVEMSEHSEESESGLEEPAGSASDD